MGILIGIKRSARMHEIHIGSQMIPGRLRNFPVIVFLMIMKVSNDIREQYGKPLTSVDFQETGDGKVEATVTYIDGEVVTLTSEDDIVKVTTKLQAQHQAFLAGEQITWPQNSI